MIGIFWPLDSIRGCRNIPQSSLDVGGSGEEVKAEDVAVAASLVVKEDCINLIVKQQLTAAGRGRDYKFDSYDEIVSRQILIGQEQVTLSVSLLRIPQFFQTVLLSQSLHL